MQDQPSMEELLEAVRNFLKDRIMPQLKGHDAFHARVAVNALDIVRRELDVAPRENSNELESLKTLLRKDGTLEELNRELCRQIRSGELTLETPNLKDHLWKTTLTKLAIDQPKYTAYRRAVEDDA